MATIRSRAVPFEPAHGSQPGLEPAVVGLDPVVRVGHGDVLGGGQQLVEHPRVGGGPVGGHFRRRGGAGQRPGEEPPGRLLVPFRRQQHVDDLAELVDRPVQVPPPAGDLHIGLVDEPPVSVRFTDLQRQVLTAFADTIVAVVPHDPDPDGFFARAASDLGVAPVAERLLQAVPARQLAGLTELLDAMAGMGLHTQPLPGREMIVNAVAASGPEARLGVDTLRQLCALLAYGAPDPATGINPFWSTWGYPGPGAPAPAGVETDQPARPRGRYHDRRGRGRGRLRLGRRCGGSRAGPRRRVGGDRGNGRVFQRG